jgi:hypothetical protein
MITKETLEAVRVGRLSNDQLKEAVTHYRLLKRMLDCHNAHSDKYSLMWKDVSNTLDRLEYCMKLEKESKPSKMYN